MKYLSICAILFGLILQDNANAAADAYTFGKKAIMGAELTYYVQRYKDATVLGRDFLKDIPSSFFISGVLDLSSFTKVKEVGDYFLESQRGLTGVILPPNLECIGSNFLAHCSGLTTIDLTPLAKINYVGRAFLSGCCGLTTIDLTPLAKISDVGIAFLSACSGLTTVDFSPLSGVRRIGDYFLSGCVSLIIADLSPFVYVETVSKYYFLSACYSLKTVILPCTSAFAGVDFSRIKTLSSGMMIMDDGTIRLPHERVNHILYVLDERYREISRLAFENLYVLTGLQFSPYIIIMSDVIIMRDGSIEFPDPCVNGIRSIIHEYDESRNLLEEVKLQDLAHVRELCPYFLAENKLRQVDLSPLENVSNTNDGFLSGNALLEGLVI
ncbi:MAG: hypothetical protein CNLJKLNK_00092 [Holosporales bacterium]